MEFAQTHIHWVSDTIQPSHPLQPLLLMPSIFPSIRIVPNELSLCITWPKYWSFSFSISPSIECSGLISILNGLVWSPFCQRTLRSLLQHSAFFKVQLSHLYMTTGKTITLTIWTCVSKVMSLLFNMLSRFVVAALPRSRRLLISP